jgi:hypothetical protein
MPLTNFLGDYGRQRQRAVIVDAGALTIALARQRAARWKHRALQSSVPIWRGRSSSTISPMTLTNNARISTLLSIQFVVRLET